MSITVLIVRALLSDMAWGRSFLIGWGGGGVGWGTFHLFSEKFRGPPSQTKQNL